MEKEKYIEEENCPFNGKNHGHCIECGKITTPIMECECEFRKIEELVKQTSDKIWNGGNRLTHNELDDILQTLLSQAQSATRKEVRGAIEDKLKTIEEGIKIGLFKNDGLLVIKSMHAIPSLKVEEETKLL